MKILWPTENRQNNAKLYPNQYPSLIRSSSTPLWRSFERM